MQVFGPLTSMLQDQDGVQATGFEPVIEAIWELNQQKILFSGPTSPIPTWVLFGLALVQRARPNSPGEGRSWAAQVPMAQGKALRLPSGTLW